MISQPRHLFLLDGLGALLTAILPLFITAIWPGLLGMPLNVLYMLSGIALVYSMYSLSCFALKPLRWKPLLSIIVYANIAYCILTFALVIHFFSSLPLLGRFYFWGEIGIVAGLVGFEVHFLRHK